MRELKATIHGEGIEKLPEAIRNRLPDAELRDEGDVRIVLAERYYFRNNSNLLTVVICRPTSPDEYHVMVVTGGGATGLLNITLGSEDSRNDEVIRTIRDICTDNRWEINAS
jgi:hypothetical protein